jgi:hypothetical protein
MGMTYLEKIRWRKENDRNPLFTVYCDKAESRKLVPKEYLLPYEVKEVGEAWEINRPIVVKHNASSGRNIILPAGGSNKDIPSSWFKTKYGVNKGEWGYAGARECLLVEDLLCDFPDVYRFECFSGKCEAISIYEYEPFISKPDVKAITTYRARDKKLLEVQWRARKVGRAPLDKRTDEMIALAEKLASDIDYVRVDLMTSRRGVFFSELTPYPMSGVGPLTEWFDKWMGSLWKLPEVNK